MKSVYDVAIIGGGPAGCSAAITLAERGLQVGLFEAKTYPHHKVCGEFLSPECTAVLRDLGALPALMALRPVPIEVAQISAPSGTAWETHFPQPGLGISRSALDSTLARHCRDLGVEVQEGTTVTGLCGNLAEGFKIETRDAAGRAEVRARAVIAAHGKRSTVDRVLKRPFLEHSQPFVAFKTHLYGPALPNRIDLHGIPGGYCGMSEIEDGRANVCFLVHEPVFKKFGGSLQPFLQWMQNENPRLRAWLTQAELTECQWLSIGQVPFSRKEAVSNDILMAGDAAGLVVPLAGDGIAMALESGKLAGRCTSEYLAGRLTSSELRASYTGRWRQQFGSRLTLARFLQVFMLRPRLLSWGLRLLVAAPPVGKYLVIHTRGKGVGY